MLNEWNLKIANIVIPVLNGITNNKPFKREKLIETFKSGIKSVCSTKKKEQRWNFFKLNSN